MDHIEELFRKVNSFISSFELHKLAKSLDVEKTTVSDEAAFLSMLQVMQRFEESEFGEIQMPSKDRCTLTKNFYLLPY